MLIFKLRMLFILSFPWELQLISGTGIAGLDKRLQSHRCIICRRSHIKVIRLDLFSIEVLWVINILCPLVRWASALFEMQNTRFEVRSCTTKQDKPFGNTQPDTTNMFEVLQAYTAGLVSCLRWKILRRCRLRDGLTVCILPEETWISRAAVECNSSRSICCWSLRTHSKPLGKQTRY